MNVKLIFAVLLGCLFSAIIEGSEIYSKLKVKLYSTRIQIAILKNLAENNEKYSDFVTILKGYLGQYLNTNIRSITTNEIVHKIDEFASEISLFDSFKTETFMNTEILKNHPLNSLGYSILG